MPASASCTTSTWPRLTNPRLELHIGIMSGTSLDGIDVALVAFTQGKPQLRATHYRPYGTALKETLLALHQPAANELHLAYMTANELAREYASATCDMLHAAGIAAEDVRSIGCHGQTIRHCPEQGYTVQIGNSALLAELTDITVVSDFRSRDIAAGGHGAPLVPAFHDMTLRHPSLHRVIVNIGGIANLSNLPPGAATIGFDCGPGNMLMDAWIAQHRGEAYDNNGAWAAQGKVIPAMLQAMKNEPYFSAAPPKSCGRDLFSMDWLKKHLQGGEAPADVQATLLALTGESIAEAIGKFCPGTQEVYLCGGGAHNSALRNYLGQALPDCRIQLTDALGVGADWMEAIAFAWLARQALHGTPANLPQVTGAAHPCILGAIYPSHPLYK
ncbi:MAG TPA: anhydro-N-acetylmuramic acid kinase [Gallionellaceae bacterium]